MLVLANKKILVVGLGKSGRSVAEKAIELGAEVFAYEETADIRRRMSDIRNLKLLPSAVNSAHFEVRQLSTLGFDLVITSPGIPFSHPILKLAAKKAWPVISEIEFGYQVLEPAFVIGITGTNGKTTVTELVGHIFKASDKDYQIAGNIGTPLSSLEKTSKILILELSSFQLHFIEKFRANIGVILNIEEDHLDWHCCFGQYLKDKLKIFSNQQSNDIALLNIDDPLLQNKKFSDGKIITFSSNCPADYHLKKGYLTVGEERIIALDDLMIKGRHNIANALAAAACAIEAGIELEVVRKGLKTFSGLKHRLQFILSRGGVSFFNDSKSTNPHSVKKAVEAFNGDVILIMGGRNKGNNFSFLQKYLENKVKELVLYGEAASEIANQANGGVIYKTIEEALRGAVKNAKEGDTVLFSPGCASFDLYQNYAERGDAFIDEVEKLEIRD